jgi:transposase
LRWRDAPKEYGPLKTLDNRWKRWSDKGTFAQMMAGLAAKHGAKTFFSSIALAVLVICWL